MRSAGTKRGRDCYEDEGTSTSSNTASLSITETLARQQLSRLGVRFSLDLLVHADHHAALLNSRPATMLHVPIGDLVWANEIHGAAAARDSACGEITIMKSEGSSTYRLTETLNEDSRRWWNEHAERCRGDEE